MKNKINITRQFVLLYAVLSAIPAGAQYNYYRGHNSKYPPREGGVSSSISYYTYRYSYYEHNDCRRFLDSYNSYNYLDSIHAKDVKFKTVTLYRYAADDSLFTQGKKLRSKAVYYFNKTGEITLIKVYDTIGKIDDSTLVRYDSKGNRTRITDYDHSTSPDKLMISNDEQLLWDNKNRMVYDSDFEKKSEVTRYDTSQYLISRVIYKYDDSNNVVFQQSLNNDDTTIEYNTYDNKNRIISRKGYQYKAWTYNIYTYDKNGNETSNIYVFNTTDTNSSSSVYDANRLLSDRVYTDGRLTKMESWVFNADSSHSQTEETFGDNTGPSCPEDKKIISLYNTHHGRYSQVTTQEENGKLMTTTDLDKFHYNKTGKVLSDSEIVTGKSQWHWDRTLTICTYKYDAKGNKIEFLMTGGESINSNYKHTWAYNEKNMVTDHEEFGSCMDKPFKTYVTTYYPDGETVKENIDTQGQTIKSNTFGKDSRYLKKTETDKYGNSMWVWEYTEW